MSESMPVRQMVRMLGPNALAVLVILADARQPVDQGYVCRWTGLSDKLVAEALGLLLDAGMASRNGRYAWQITGIVRQLPLMALTLADEVADGNAVQTGDGHAVPERDSEFPCPVSSSSSRFSDSKILDPQPLLPESSSEPDYSSQQQRDALVAELVRQGVRDPARSRLAALPFVTVEKIRYHCKTAATLGQAIYRIEHDWPVKDGGGAATDEGVADRRRRYAEGPFGQYVNH